MTRVQPLFGDLLTMLLAPYDDITRSRRGKVTVPRMSLGERRSDDPCDGHPKASDQPRRIQRSVVRDPTLNMSCADDTEVMIVWTDRGGPPRA